MDNLIIFLLWLFIWGIFAIPIYTYAKRLGQNGNLYVFLALIISPLFSFLLLLANGKSDDQKFEDKLKDKEIDEIVNKQNPTVKNLPSESKYELLEKIGNLKERGILSEEEFDREKRKVLEPETENQEVEQLNPIYRLNKLLRDNKSRILDSNITLIRDTIQEICTDKEKAIQLLIQYENVYNKNLIKLLIDQSTNYNSIKENLKPFIEFGIVNAKYPHENIL